MESHRYFGPPAELQDSVPFFEEIEVPPTWMIRLERVATGSLYSSTEATGRQNLVAFERQAWGAFSKGSMGSA